MRFLVKLYDKVLEWSRHPKATRYFSVLSFIDASVFPVSPMFMFIPMAFAHPKKTFWYAFLGTIASILGGIVGYWLGVFAFDVVIEPLFNWLGYQSLYQSALVYFQCYGFWAVLLGSFSPIPYKIFTIGAGVMQLNFLLFLLASTLGRFLRFFVIGAVIWWGGPKVEPFVRRTLMRFS